VHEIRAGLSFICLPVKALLQY